MISGPVFLVGVGKEQCARPWSLDALATRSGLHVVSLGFPGVWSSPLQ